MSELHIIGINHQSTNLELREQLMFVPNLITKAYQSIQTKCEIDEVVLISTCARTECIVTTNDIKKIKIWFAEFHNLDYNKIKDKIVHTSGEDAILHLMRVAAGIDSFIIGETQILGQLKKAFATAEEQGTVGSFFYKLFPTIFNTAKLVRNKTNIGSKNISLASSITSLAKKTFGNLNNCRVMLVGAGEMIHLAATHLYSNGVRSWIMANRTIEKAQNLANNFSGKDIVIEEIAKHLSNVDIVISATASPVPIIGKGLIERIQQVRNNKPLILADLAMPRDIEPEVNQVDGVELYHIDNLKAIIMANRNHRNQAIKLAEPMINNACLKFIKEQNSRQQVEVIRNFRNHVQKIEAAAIKQAIQQLQTGSNSEQVVTNAINKFAQKLIHTPTINLRLAARNHDHDVIQCAGQIFNLEKIKEEINER